MRQPEDSRTLDLLESAGAIKRRRGRPRLEHALSDKERAKRYRDNKRKRLASEGSKKAATVLANTGAEPGEEIAQLRKERELLRADLAAMSAIAEDLITARRDHKRIPSDVFKNITQSHLKITLRHDFI